MKGQVNMALKVSKGVGPSETGQATVEGLSLYLQRLSKLPHALCETIASLLVGTEMLDLPR